MGSTKTRPIPGILGDVFWTKKPKRYFVFPNDKELPIGEDQIYSSRTGWVQTNLRAMRVYEVGPLRGSFVLLKQLIQGLKVYTTLTLAKAVGRERQAVEYFEYRHALAKKQAPLDIEEAFDNAIDAVEARSEKNALVYRKFRDELLHGLPPKTDDE